MTDIILQGTDRVYALPLTLQLVKDLEAAGGSLFKIADMLLQNELPMADMLTLLSIAYRAAGCTLPAPALEEFLPTVQPAILLSQILIGLLAPLHDLGAVSAET